MVTQAKRWHWLVIVASVSAALGEGIVQSPATPEALINTGHFKQARVLVEQRFRSNPDAPETLWLMSLIKQIWDDRDTALKLAEKAVAIDSRNARYHLRLAEVLGEMAQRADILQRLDLAERFKREIGTTLSLDPGNTKALRHLMEFNLVAPSIAGGDKSQAKAIAEQIMRIDAVEGYFAEARLAKYTKEVDRLGEIYQSAVKVRPESYDAHAALGNYFLSSAARKYDDAEREARVALRLDPGRIDAYNLLVAALVFQKKWSELDRILALSERNVPDNLAPYYRAAAACIDSGGIEWRRAESYLRKYLTIDPERYMPTHAYAHWRLGQAIEKQGRRADALVEYRLSVHADPESPAKKELTRLK
jgi:tetratricopeptide (TPR) repeat protein